MRRLWLSISILLTVAVAGFACAEECTTHDDCPSGQQCGGDNKCFVLPVGEPGTGTTTSTPAGFVDGVPPPPDGGVPIDAGVHPDARP